MDAAERAKMEAMGYAIVDDAAEWLELTEVERRVVEFRVGLGRAIRLRREAAGRVEESDVATEGAATDRLLRAYFSTGGTIEGLSEALAQRDRATPEVEDAAR